MSERAKLTLIAVTPRGKMLEEAADSLIIPGKDGYIGIMRDHMPMLAATSQGEIKYKTDSVEHSFPIKDGIAEVRDNTVTVFTD